MFRSKTNVSGVYVHIPFCRQKCHYCAFLSYAGISPAVVDEFILSLIKEIAAAPVPDKTPGTVFFGGGTPTCLTLGQLVAIKKALCDKGFWAAGQERTIEANPGTVDADSLYALREMGFNRINFGVQSFSDRLLNGVNRLHTAAQAMLALDGARQSGWENIGLDLMYGLPGQTFCDFQSSLAAAASSGARHISVYGLTVEPGTVLDAMMERGETALPDPDEEDAMYDLAENYLTGQGFVRYEIANYARPGYECKHNDQYWRYLPYRGFGPAAVSFDGGARAAHTGDLANYIKYPCVTIQEVLTAEDAMAEFVFMNLRRAAGFSPGDFQRRFGRGLYEVYGEELADNEQRGLIVTEGDCVRLTGRGQKYGNRVFMSFLPG